MLFQPYLYPAADVFKIISSLCMPYEKIPLTIDEQTHEFVMMIEDKKALIDFKQKGNKIYLVHTEVPPEIEGKGVAAALVDKVLHYIEEHDLQLVPQCSYVKQYLQKHSEWNKLLAEGE